MQTGYPEIQLPTRFGTTPGESRIAVESGVAMRNITVSLDDESYRTARIVAAQRDTSVSALVKQFLTSLSVENEVERLKALEREARESITGFSASDRIPRDELHERRP